MTGFDEALARLVAARQLDRHAAPQAVVRGAGQHQVVDREIGRGSVIVGSRFGPLKTTGKAPSEVLVAPPAAFSRLTVAPSFVEIDPTLLHGRSVEVLATND